MNVNLKTWPLVERMEAVLMGILDLAEAGEFWTVPPANPEFIRYLQEARAIRREIKEQAPSSVLQLLCDQIAQETRQ